MRRRRSAPGQGEMFPEPPPRHPAASRRPAVEPGDVKVAPARRRAPERPVPPPRPDYRDCTAWAPMTPAEVAEFEERFGRRVARGATRVELTWDGRLVHVWKVRFVVDGDQT